MAKKAIVDKLSIYVPKNKIDQHPVERLIKLGAAKDRSVNYLVVDAVLEYLDREEKKPEEPAAA
jgi:predicted transcriptional regulator